ncbi:HNH endonuclease [Aliarcobacter butzleri]|uniref:HNH endonuclease n=1 Tax=Aliarcobacter butzleri TaxID=28197 RepID=UPI00344B781C
MKKLDIFDNSLQPKSLKNFEKLKNTILKSINNNFVLDELSDILNINHIHLNKIFKRILFFYLIKRLVNTAKYSNLISIFNNDISGKKNILINLLEKNFNFSNDFINGLADNLIDLEDNLNTNLVKVNMSKSNAYTTKLMHYAITNNFRCYICGSEVDYTNPNAVNYRGIEHFIPRSMGGDKSTKNLFIACKDCNEAKKSYISWIESDFHNKHSIFYNIYKKENKLENDLSALDKEDDKITFKEEHFQKKITTELIYIVSSMNNYKCSMCSTDNDISHRTFIIKKEESDYCHPLNLTTICDKCLNNIEDSFNYIIKKRISNVNN